MTEVVIDRLEAVQVEEHQCDWTGLARSQAVVEVSDHRPAIQQPGQVIVFGEILESLFGNNAGLHLSE